eukprot:scaffold119489_cov42-Prasinocladus_malaysianus.AAC.1
MNLRPALASKRKAASRRPKDTMIMSWCLTIVASRYFNFLDYAKREYSAMDWPPGPPTVRVRVR